MGPRPVGRGWVTYKGALHIVSQAEDPWGCGSSSPNAGLLFALLSAEEEGNGRHGPVTRDACDVRVMEPLTRVN